ncbi:hypothetical protein NW766_005563 [Fusarium irregulare]|uniref:Uncharacterized protein n=1 Tax=Fusarium irregulare TaxID=2494466 RepID=A0A9W8PR90_9HYPO|nr:hypothetical protein NW766_005563 [Fusarium irregulare]
MNSIHTIADYQTRSTGTTPVLSGFPSLDSAHEVIFRPTQLSATRQGFSVQTAEEKHHSPSPEGPSTFTRVALSAVAAGLSSAATTYSHAVIYREMFTRPRSAHSTGARSEQPIEIVEPSTRTGSEALNDQHSAVVVGNETESSDPAFIGSEALNDQHSAVAAGNETESSDPASISSVPNSNPDQNTEPSQGDTGSLEDVSSSIAPSQSNDSAEKMDATQQNANQHDQTLAPTNCTSPTTETHQKPVARGDIEVRIRSRGTDIGSGATEYSASYDRQQEHTRDLGVQFFNQGRESSFMSVGSAI